MAETPQAVPGAQRLERGPKATPVFNIQLDVVTFTVSNCANSGEMVLRPVTAQINLRPLRVGFLVDPTNRVALSKAMRLATCMWGGMMCPLIPVMKRIPKSWRTEWERISSQEMTRGYLRFFEPDIFVETARGQIEAAGLSISAFRDEQRCRSFSSLIRKDHGLEPDLDLGVNMYHVYDHLHRTEFQFQKRVQPRILDFGQGDSAAVAFFETAFGCFPKGKTLSYLPRVYRQALGGEIVEPTADQWREIIERGAGFPLYYTTRDLDTQFETRSDPSAFIFDPLNPLDVIDFWNFRIFTRDVLPVSSHWLAESRDTLLKYIRANHRPLPTNPNGIMIRTAIHVGRSMNVEQVAEQLKLSDSELPEGSCSIQGWYEPIWREQDGQRVFRPAASVLSAKSRDVQLVPSDDSRPTVRFPVQTPDFDTHHRGAGPTWVNAVRVRQYGSPKYFADALPSAALGGREGYPLRSSGEQFISREGYVTFHTYASDEGYLELPRRDQAVISWLKSEGIVATPSEAGRIAEQVIEAVGGLGGVNLLREREVLELLDKMARSRRDWPDGSSDEFQDRTAKVATWIATLSKVQKRLWGRWKTLDRYVDAGVLRLGLTVDCTYCGKENWYSLDDIGATIPCGRCLKTFTYPQGEPQRKDLWKYRVIGPFATPHYAEGSYCVALTLRFLEHEISSMGEFTYATGLELQRGDQRLETDFFAWHNRHGLTGSGPDPKTFVGECKSLGVDAFKAKDIARLKLIAEALPGAYIVAATLKDRFGPEEVARLRSLAQWGWKRARPARLITLTGVELFGEGPFSRVWQDAGGRLAEVLERHRHIFDFETLAMASQEAHLGFSGDEMYAMRYHKHRRKGR